MKFAVSAIFYATEAGASGLKRNDKLPLNDQLRVNRVSEARPARNATEIDEPPTIEVEGKVEADDLPRALAFFARCIVDVADPEGFLDMEIEPV